MTDRFGEAVPYPRHENENVNKVALAVQSKQVREKYNQELARPDVVLDDPLQGVRPVLLIVMNKRTHGTIRPTGAYGGGGEEGAAMRLRI